MVTCCRRAEPADAALAEAYNGNIMTSHNIESPSVSEICAQVKHLGYAVSGQIRLYGEEFEVLSDPFPEDDGIAVRVKTKKSSRIRVLQLPATVLQSVKGRGTRAA
jgi:hypothetical protein